MSCFGFSSLMPNCPSCFVVVTVTILDDIIPEDDEQFTIQLTNPGGGASLGSFSYITVIILANDNVAGVLAFNTTSILAAEGLCCFV